MRVQLSLLLSLAGFRAFAEGAVVCVTLLLVAKEFIKHERVGSHSQPKHQQHIAVFMCDPKCENGNYFLLADDGYARLRFVTPTLLSRLCFVSNYTRMLLNPYPKL